jgi:glycosyltransferase involved in cell wall biosynthesis
MNDDCLLVVSPAYPPPFVGGSKVWTFNMVENSGYTNYEILTSKLKDDCEEVINPNYKIHRSKYLWDSNTSNPSRRELFVSYSYIIKYIINRSRKTKYKAVIGGAFDFANGILIILCKFLKIPIICLGNAEEFTLTLKGKGFKNWIKRSWLKFTHKRADGFIVVCDFCKDILSSIGVDAQKIHVVPSSINPNKISKELIDRSAGYNIISVGRIIERKGFHKLILATKKLINDFPDIHTHIVGDGPYFHELRRIINENNLEKHVTLHGRVSDEALADLYKKSQLFVLAHMMLENGDTEGCPTVFSEASGQGLPVIGGTDAGASTVILEGKTGYIVNSRDIDKLSERMKDILSNPELAKSMGQKGIKKIMNDHTPQVTGKRFINSINKIISN